MNKHNKEAHVSFITCLYIPVYISSPSGVHTFVVLLVRRISLYINPLNDHLDIINYIFVFFFKADAIEQFLKKRVALPLSAKLTRSAY